MSETEKRWHPATAAAHALGWEDETTRSLIPPIYLTSTYIRDPDNQYRTGWSYGRPHNPTHEVPERLLSHLEGGAAAMLFSSGMAAATAVFLALRPGDHVVAPKVMYWGLRHWLMGFATEWGLRVELVDAGDLGAIKSALRPGKTKLLWLESPANPTWVVTDIAAAAELAHKAGARVAIDSTVAAAMLTNPIKLGCDLVMHSATKYLNGHTDVVAGALVTAVADEFWTRLVALRTSNGAILGPVEAWLLLRGMRTLPLRVERACRNAMTVAERFARDPRVAAVLYPGLATHPGHAIAAKQMTGGFGGMLGIRIKRGEEAAISTASRVRVWKRATSLGGVESLVEHRASIEGAGSPAPPDLLRLSAGIEDAQDLIDDLDQALGN